MKAMKSTKIRKSAKGEDCQVRIPGICNFNPETVVGAHRNGAGWSLKQPDNEMAYCCSACHDVLDRRKKTDFTDCELKLMHLEGIMRTQKILFEKGLLKYG